FELHFVDPTGNDLLVGSIRFPRTHPTIPSAMVQTGTSFEEVYDGATTCAALPDCNIAIQLRGDGVAPTTATSEYPAYPAPNPSFPNADVSYDKASDRVFMKFGGATRRCHPAGKLF